MELLNAYRSLNVQFPPPSVLSLTSTNRSVTEIRKETSKKEHVALDTSQGLNTTRPGFIEQSPALSEDAPSLLLKDKKIIKKS